MAQTATAKADTTGKAAKVKKATQRFVGILYDQTVVCSRTAWRAMMTDMLENGKVTTVPKGTRTLGKPVDITRLSKKDIEHQLSMVKITATSEKIAKRISKMEERLAKLKADKAAAEAAEKGTAK